MQKIKQVIIDKLKSDILLWQGFKPAISGGKKGFDLGPVEAAFPNGIFPVGTLHEWVCNSSENQAACAGFISGLIKTLTSKNGVCLWIGLSQTIFPPALKTFGIEPDRVVFIDVRLEKNILWATEEALKCTGLAAVIAEVQDMTFTQSRRLQLAVEKSSVTGFLLRNNIYKLNNTACFARWRITPLPGEVEDDMPGVGFPRWHVELLKVRNGNPGAWDIGWKAGQFIFSAEKETATILPLYRKKAG